MYFSVNILEFFLVYFQVNYLLPAISCIIVFLAFNQQSYVSSVNFPATFLLLLLYGYVSTLKFNSYTDMVTERYLISISYGMEAGQNCPPLKDILSLHHSVYVLSKNSLLSTALQIALVQENDLDKLKEKL